VYLKDSLCALQQFDRNTRHFYNLFAAFFIQDKKIPEILTIKNENENEKIIVKNENDDIGNKTKGDIELSQTIKSDSKVVHVPNQCIRQCSLLLPKCPIDLNSIAIRFILYVYMYI
jgi:hypothetical protein